MTEHKPTGMNDVLAKWLMGVYASITVALILWGFNDISGIHQKQSSDSARIATLEERVSSHFNSSDERDMRKDLNEVKVMLARLEEKLGAIETQLRKQR